MVACRGSLLGIDVDSDPNFHLFSNDASMRMFQGAHHLGGADIRKEREERGLGEGRGEEFSD